MSNQEIKSHPGVAAVLSFLFNGLGQLYNGQIFKGLLIIFISAVSTLVLVIGGILIAFWLQGKDWAGQQAVLGIVLFLSGTGAICFLGIYSILDAYRVAKGR